MARSWMMTHLSLVVMVCWTLNLMELVVAEMEMSRVINHTTMAKMENLVTMINHKRVVKVIRSLAAIIMENLVTRGIKPVISAEN